MNSRPVPAVWRMPCHLSLVFVVLYMYGGHHATIVRTSHNCVASHVAAVKESIMLSKGIILQPIFRRPDDESVNDGGRGGYRGSIGGSMNVVFCPTCGPWLLQSWNSVYYTINKTSPRCGVLNPSNGKAEHCLHLDLYHEQYEALKFAYFSGRLQQVPGCNSTEIYLNGCHVLNSIHSLTLQKC